jgi:hypothetical protein
VSIATKAGTFIWTPSAGAETTGPAAETSTEQDILKLGNLGRLIRLCINHGPMSCRGGQGLLQLFFSFGKEQYVLQKGSLEREKRRPFPQAKEASVNRPEMVDKEPGSFYLSVNLQAYRTQSFAFLPEIQGNQKERVELVNPKGFPTFPFRGKN